jgi:hypothetical protein
MESLNQNTKRELIGEFYKQHMNTGKRFTVNHFLQMNFPERRIYYIINKVENGESLDQKKGSGRKAVKMPENMREKLEKEAIGGVDKTKKTRTEVLYFTYICKQYIERKKYATEK